MFKAGYNVHIPCSCGQVLAAVLIVFAFKRLQLFLCSKLSAGCAFYGLAGKRSQNLIVSAFEAVCSSVLKAGYNLRIPCSSGQALAAVTIVFAFKAVCSSVLKAGYNLRIPCSGGQALAAVIIVFAFKRLQFFLCSKLSA